MQRIFQILMNVWSCQMLALMANVWTQWAVIDVCAMKGTKLENLVKNV